MKRRTRRTIAFSSPSNSSSCLIAIRTPVMTSIAPKTYRIQWNSRDEHRADADEQAAHHQRAEDSVEQHAVLADLRNAEVLEDQNDDEDVVDAERFLDDVAGEERQPDFVSVEQEEAGGERRARASPRRRSRSPLPSGEPRAAVGGTRRGRARASRARTPRSRPRTRCWF